MTQRLPTPGGDNGTWGDILNSFLEVSLASDGTLNPGVVGTNQLEAGSVTNTQLDSPTQTAIASIASKYTKPSGGIPGSDIANATITSTQLDSTTNTNLTKANTSVQLGGDLGGTATSPTIAKLQGITLTPGTPGNNQVLTYTSSGNQWVPATVSSTAVSNATTSAPGIVQLAGDLGGSGTTATAPTIANTTNVQTVVNTIIGSNATVSSKAPLASPTLTGTTTTSALSTTSFAVTGGSGATAPGVGKVLTSDSSGNATWATPSTGSTTLAADTDVTITSPSNNQVLTYSTSSSKWINATSAGGASNATSSTPGLIQLDGDLGGTATSPTVAKLNGGITLPGSAPSASGQVLTTTSSGSAATTAWSTPAAGVTLDSTSTDIQPLGTRSAGSVGKAADAGHVHAMPSATQVGALPSTDDLSAIATANATAATVSLNSNKISNLANGVAATDAANISQLPNVGTTAVGGDLSGTVANATVAKVNGITISGTPSTNQVLTATAANAADWQTPSAGSGATKATNLPTFNVRDYGGKCDGVTDDSAALATTFAAMLAAGRGTLYAPGSYIANPVSFYGGYSNPLTGDANWTSLSPGALRFVLDIKAKAGIGAAVSFSGMYAPEVEVKMDDGGGQAATVTDATTTGSAASVTSAQAVTAGIAVGNVVIIRGGGPVQGLAATDFFGTVSAVNSGTGVISLTDTPVTSVTGGSMTLMDVGVHFENVLGPRWNIYGKNFAGALLHADASGNAAKNIVMIRPGTLENVNCGMAFFWKSVSAQGSLGSIWSNPAYTDYVGLCADTGWDYYTGGVGGNGGVDNNDVYLFLDRDNDCMFDRIDIGDRATEACVKIAGGDVGRIGMIRGAGSGTSHQPGSAGIELCDVTSIHIAQVLTKYSPIGVSIIGGGGTSTSPGAIRIMDHQSLTGDTHALSIQPSTTQTAPNIDIGGSYRNTALDAVVIASGFTGGRVRLRGDIQLPNTNLQTSPLPNAVTCNSGMMLLDVADLWQVKRNPTYLGWGVYHVNPDNLRGIRRAKIENLAQHGIPIIRSDKITPVTIPAIAWVAELIHGGSGITEVQQIMFNSGVTGGTFTVTFSGQTTSAQTFGATSASVLQTALQGLSNIGAGNVLVEQDAPTAPYLITFAGSMAGLAEALMTINGTSLTGTLPSALNTAGIPSQNNTDRTMVLNLTFRMQPTSGNNSNPIVGLGPTASSVTETTFVDIDYGASMSNSYYLSIPLRVPPGWWFSITVGVATTLNLQSYYYEDA